MTFAGLLAEIVDAVRDRSSRLYQRAPYRARVAIYIGAMTVVAGLVGVHSLMVRELAARSERMSNREAELYAYALTEKLLHRQSGDFLDDIMRGSEAPLLYTRVDGTPVHWRNIPFGRHGQRVSEGLPWSQLPTRERETVLRFRDQNDLPSRSRPIVLGGTPLGILYHGNYDLEWKMPWLMLGGIVAVGLLAGLAWFGLKVMQGTERSLLWVGLARETAHQLGTPISSLLGWIEFLRLKTDGKDPAVARISDEMARDLSRLRQVVARFSQIGSLPDLHAGNVNSVVQACVDYFAPRLPHQGVRRVRLESVPGDLPDVLFNAELLGWVLENLVKNALDAMDNPDGLIRIRTQPAGRNDRGVRIEVEDNGRGIRREHLKDVFSPGWSTKKRGWGLGLALARRIVEQYHGGRIWVERTRLGEGTTFSIVLDDPALRRPKPGTGDA